MASTTTLNIDGQRFRRYNGTAILIFYFTVVAYVSTWFLGFYRPDTGFSALITIGDARIENLHPLLLDQNPYIERNSYGYDGQMYAQIALKPVLDDAQLRQGVDSLYYRARRILFCVVPYAFGLGEPRWVLFVFSVQNLFFWLGTAWLLAKWLPPTSWRHAAGWAGTLLCAGYLMSLRNALIEGPTLFLIALGMWQLEAGRKGWATALFGLCGLARETSVLCAAGLAEGFKVSEPRTWKRVLLSGVLVATPVFLWAFWLRISYGGESIGGISLITYPFIEYFAHWREIITDFQANNGYSWFALAMMISLTMQAIWLGWKRDFDSPWWRLGAAYVVLMLVLGKPVWEGYPSAASRVLLPMTLAFNVLAVRKRVVWPVLLFGNLFLVCAPHAMSYWRIPKAHELYGPTNLLRTEKNAVWSVEYSRYWHSREHTFSSSWRRSRSPSEFIVVHNPHAVPVRVRIRFGLGSEEAIKTRIAVGSLELFSGTLKPDERVTFDQEIVVSQGDNVITFSCPEAPQQTKPPERNYVYVYDLRIDLVSR